MRTFGMSGQAVLEGVLMKNDEKYALAVRKPDNDIEVTVERFQSLSDNKGFCSLPFIRGIVKFIEEIYLGMKNFSALDKIYKEQDNKTSGGSEIRQFLIAIAIISLSLGLFIAMPYGLSFMLGKRVESIFLQATMEGGIRLALIVLYIIGISMLPDIKRFYMYLGASNKVMNCIDKGIPLTVSNVRRMGKKSYKCGTVFVFTVILISLILFMFIRFEEVALRILFRILVIPFVASVVYEIIRLSAKTSNIIVMFLNLPTMLVQGIVVDEPAEDIIEVAIRSASAVFGNEEVIEEELISPKLNDESENKIDTKPEKKANKKIDKKIEKKQTGKSESGLKRVSRQKLEENNTTKPETKSDEDDEILNALNHFFNSKKAENKKEESKNRGKRK